LLVSLLHVQRVTLRDPVAYHFGGWTQQGFKLKALKGV
jgi:hypothetical protein